LISQCVYLDLVFVASWQTHAVWHRARAICIPDDDLIVYLAGTGVDWRLTCWLEPPPNKVAHPVTATTSNASRDPLRIAPPKSGEEEPPIRTCARNRAS
jgi:hypothetical protein